MDTHTELDALEGAFEKKKNAAMQDYFTFLKFQSISSESAYKNDVLACSEWVAAYLKNIGFAIEIWPTSGHPTIFATYTGAGPSQPTLLIYNHYDVQPVDPLNLWQSPPFEPTMRDEQVYARGAQDNKGQCFYVLLALKTLMELNDGKLPINIKLCIEGEEECGSSGLSGILPDKREELHADYLAIVDLGFHLPNKPTITLGVRGLVALDVEVIGSKIDLHSGFHGGLAYNPLHALTALLAKVRDPSGKITIPGFYEDVLPLSETIKSSLSLDFDQEAYHEMFGILPTGGEKEFSLYERNWIRPTFEVNGIHGGYGGAGFKTVIPAKASAKISCRLVPNQDPHQIGKLVASYLKAHAPNGVEVAVHIHPGGGKSIRADINSRIVKAFATAYQEIFESPCEFIFSGASIPIVDELAAASSSEVVLVGLGLPGDCIHAPNEHFGFDRIKKGFLSIARVIQLLSN